MFDHLKDNNTDDDDDYDGFQHESPGKHSHLFNDTFVRFQGVRSPVERYLPARALHGRRVGGVASLFQILSCWGDRGSRMLFAGERGGGQECPRF